MAAEFKAPRRKKKAIPSLMRTQVWNRWIGIDRGQVKCPYCQINNITPFFFECGHVLAEARGGEVTIENLRPICRECNVKMATQSIDLTRYTLLDGISQSNSYPTTLDGHRVFIEANSLTNLRGDIGSGLVRLTYSEAKKLAAERWKGWLEVYEMGQSRPVLITGKKLHLNVYSDALYTSMICSSNRSAVSSVLNSLCFWK